MGDADPFAARRPPAPAAGSGSPTHPLVYLEKRPLTPLKALDAPSPTAPPAALAPSVMAVPAPVTAPVVF